MKSSSLLTGALLAVLASGAHAYNITDTYFGGDDHGKGDVIGKKSYFDIMGADVSVSGTLVTVDIYTKFDDHIGVYGNSNKRDAGKGIGVGDLFLSSQWNPNGSAPYLNDDNSTGTVWTYGLAIDGDRYSDAGGSASLFGFNSAINDDNALLSDDYLKSNWSFRNGQEVAVDTQSETTVDTGVNGSWSVGNNLISFVFDAAGTTLLDGPELAIHWGMTCGNDVIEGAVATVDEPATLALIGLSLAGLGMARRRKS